MSKVTSVTSASILLVLAAAVSAKDYARLEIQIPTAELHVTEAEAGIYRTFGGREYRLVKKDRLKSSRINLGTQFRVDVDDNQPGPNPYWILGASGLEGHGHRHYTPGQEMAKAGVDRQGNKLRGVVLAVRDFRIYVDTNAKSVNVLGGGAYLARSDEFKVNTSLENAGFVYVQPTFGSWGKNWLVIDLNRKTVAFRHESGRLSNPGMRLTIHWKPGATGTKKSGLEDGTSRRPQPRSSQPPRRLYPRDDSRVDAGNTDTAPRLDPDYLGSVAQLLEPANQATLYPGSRDGTRPLVWKFRWTAVPGAEAYELAVRRIGASQPVIQMTVRGTSFQRTDRGSFIAPANWKDWYWSVRAIRNGQKLPWAASRWFHFAESTIGDPAAHPDDAERTRPPERLNPLPENHFQPGLIPGGMRIRRFRLPKLKLPGSLRDGETSDNESGLIDPQRETPVHPPVVLPPPLRIEGLR